jgi:hypothetical protein
MGSRFKVTVAAGSACIFMLLTGCGAEVAPTSATSSYMFERSAAIRNELSYNGPSTLAEALPNHTRVTSVDGVAHSEVFSEALVVGRVAKVERGEALAYADTELHDEPVPVLVDWGDPDAAERNLLITIVPTQVVGSADKNQPLIFRLGVAAGSDPDTFLASAEALDNIAVLLARRPDGRHRGEWIPAMGALGIGVVADDGSLTFPGATSDEKAFEGGITSIEALLAAAKAPAQVDKTD